MDQKTTDALVEIFKAAIKKEVADFRAEFERENRRMLINAVKSAVQTDMLAYSKEMDLRLKLAIDAIPTPKDGASVTPEMVAESVKAWMADNPMPAPLAPTAEQISESVKGYMAEHPVVAPEPLAPEFADIAKAVGEFMTANPVTVPEPLAPTAEQLDAAVAKHFEGFEVEVPPPSLEMISKAVAEHLTENPIKVPDAPAALEPTPGQLAQAVAKHLLANPVPKGDAGLDAVEIDILPNINTERRYAKGTYARWGGGVIRASRDTEPGEPLANGWDVVIEGVKAIEVHPLGGAEFAVKSVLTGGASHVAKMAAPTFVDSYKGVWKESEGEYQRGDTVTHKGSVWLAKKTTTERPGTGEGWRLIVKAGRDGKDVNVVKLDRPETYKLDGQK